MAAPNPLGTAMIRANTDVTTVPYRKGYAPYSSVTGFHALEVRKEKPDLARDAALPCHSSITSIAVTASTDIANKSVMSHAASSPPRRRFNIELRGGLLG